MITNFNFMFTAKTCRAQQLKYNISIDTGQQLLMHGKQDMTSQSMHIYTNMKTR